MSYGWLVGIVLIFISFEAAQSDFRVMLIESGDVTEADHFGPATLVEAGGTYSGPLETGEDLMTVEVVEHGDPVRFSARLEDRVVVVHRGWLAVLLALRPKMPVRLVNNSVRLSQGAELHQGDRYRHGCRVGEDPLHPSSRGLHQEWLK